MSRWSAVERVSFEPLAILVSGSDREVQQRLGISWRRLCDARRLGVDPFTADEWAVRAGFHPLEVWGYDWAFAVDAEIRADVTVPLDDEEFYASQVA